MPAKPSTWLQKFACDVARASACSIGLSRCPARMKKQPKRRLKPTLQTKVRATKGI